MLDNYSILCHLEDKQRKAYIIRKKQSPVSGGCNEKEDNKQLYIGDDEFDDCLIGLMGYY